VSVLPTNSECDALSDLPIPPFRTANLLKSLTCFQHGVAATPPDHRYNCHTGDH